MAFSYTVNECVDTPSVETGQCDNVRASKWKENYQSADRRLNGTRTWIVHRRSNKKPSKKRKKLKNPYTDTTLTQTDTSTNTNCSRITSAVRLRCCVTVWPYFPYTFIRSFTHRIFCINKSNDTVAIRTRQTNMYRIKWFWGLVCYITIHFLLFIFISTY